MTDNFSSRDDWYLGIGFAVEPWSGARSAGLSLVENVIADRRDGFSVPGPSGPNAGRVIEQRAGHNRRKQVIVRGARHGHRLLPGRSVLRGQRAKLRP